MKKIALTLLVVSGFLAAGCQDIRQSYSHTKSSLLGLHRRITLYTAGGAVLKEYRIKGTVEDYGGTVRFLTDDGNAVIVSGTFIVEEVSK